MTLPPSSTLRSRKPVPFVRARHAALAVFAVGLLVTGVAMSRHARSNRDAAEAHFRALVEQSAEYLTARLKLYEYGLRGARGLVLSSWPEPMTRARFLRYSDARDVDHEFSGARGIGLVARVPVAEVDAFVASMRLDGAPAFSLRALTPHSRDRYIIQYIEPLGRNLEALGFDLGSDAKCRSAADASMHTGQATLTAPITLLPAASQSLPSFLFMIPIYRPGARLDTARQREAATLGWSYARLVMNDVLHDLKLDDHVSLTLSDVAEPNAPAFFASGTLDERDHRGLVSRMKIPLYGRTWLAEMRATPAFVAGLPMASPDLVGVAGAALSLVLAALAFVFGVSRQRKLDVLAQEAGRQARDLTAGLERQVSERTASLARVVRENEALLTAIHTHAIVSVTDRGGRIIEVNDAFCAISGYSAAELLGRNHRLIKSPVHDRAFFLDMWQTIAAGRPWRGQVCNLAKDGSTYWVDNLIAPLAAEDGRIERYVSIRFDITEAKVAEEKLQQTNERFAMATAGAGIGVWEFDVAHDRLKWDPWMYRLYGHAPDSGVVPELVWERQLHPDDRQVAQADVQLALRGERELDREFRILWASGEVRHLKASARVLRDHAGNPLRLTGVCFDITERKRAELALREKSSLLQTVLASASEFSIIATDPDLRIRVFNSGAENLLGYTSAEVVNRATPALIHDAEEMRVRGEELSALAGETVEGGAVFIHPLALQQPREWTYVRKDGTRVTVSLIVTAMRTGAGELFGYLGVAQDVTRRKQQEESLREATRNAEQANLAKSQFLANMSHEIRTPMNAVIGLSFLLGQTTLDAEQAAVLTKIGAASKALLGVINDILDLSKIEAGELMIDRTTFVLRRDIDEIREVMGLQASAKGIPFLTYVDDEVPARLFGDATRVRQILTNLLSNAIKFTERGSVSLRVWCKRADETLATLVFEVRDSGIGMNEDAQARVFAPFAQADASTTRRFGGTGLGLSIVKRLTDLMGGQVELVSAPGVGSLFRVTLDLSLAPVDATTNDSTDSLAPGTCGLLGARVLIVDDSEINLDVAKRILELQGARVVTVTSALQAVKHLRTAGDATDVVLMDIQMPITDGIGATGRIRHELGLRALPIIALTADARTSERDRALDAGMVDFVTKPFEAAALVRVVRHHLAARPAAVVGNPPAQRVEVPRLWPEIDGIDLSEARSRVADDHELFGRLLRRLVQDFAELASEPPARRLDATQLAAQAARMHKLKGAAGQLGALSIHRLADKAEAAYCDGDGLRGDRFAAQVSVLFQRLRYDVERLLPEVRPEDEVGDEPEVAVDAAQLSVLLAMLEGRDLRALAYYKSRRVALGRLIGDERSARLQREMANLDFDSAAEAVTEARRQCAA